MLHSNGLRIPPCGVPLYVMWNGRFSMYPALRHSETNDLTFPSAIRRATAFRSPLCGILSKPPTMSPAITHETRGYMRATSRRAVCGLCPGRNPCEHGRKSVSKIGSSAIRTACCTIRSSSVGIPSGRSLPLLFGIYTRHTDFGLYSPSCSFFESWRIRLRSMSFAVSLSIPGV